MMHRFRGLSVACGCAVLSACALGPDYKRPAVDTAPSFKEADGWKPTEPADALSRGPWWHIYNDPVLNDLEDQIDISNQNIKSAAAAVEQAQALVSEAEAGFWPTVSVGFSRTHARQYRDSPRNGNSANGQVNWPLDIWGTVRRSVESNKANEQFEEATLASARLTAQAGLAIAYFQLRVQDQFQVLLNDIVKADELSLQITENRYRVGVAARADVVTAQTQLLSSQAQQVNLGIQRGTLEHAIAVYVGQQPATFTVAPTTIRSDVPTVPAGVPSELLQRRPDIAEQERKVAQANAQIGVQEGAFFPSISLTGAVDYAAGGAISNLFHVANQTWSVGPSLTQSLFAGGLHKAQVKAARAQWEASVDDYRQTVLQGFQQVEDELVTLRVLEEQSIVEDKAVQASREAEKLTLNQYKAGTVPYSSVISAQTARLQIEQNALTVFLDRLTASVTLIEALGGGWNATQLQQPSSPPRQSASQLLAPQQPAAKPVAPENPPKKTAPDQDNPMPPPNLQPAGPPQRSPTPPNSR